MWRSQLKGKTGKSEERVKGRDFYRRKGRMIQQDGDCIRQESLNEVKSLSVIRNELGEALNNSVLKWRSCFTIRERFSLFLLFSNRKPYN